MSREIFSEEPAAQQSLGQRVASAIKDHWLAATVLAGPIVLERLPHHQAPLRFLLPTAITSFAMACAVERTRRPPIENPVTFQPPEQMFGRGYPFYVATVLGAFSFLASFVHHGAGSYDEVSRDVSTELSRRHAVEPIRETEPFVMQGTDGRLYKIVPWKAKEGIVGPDCEVLRVTTAEYKVETERPYFTSDDKMLTESGTDAAVLGAPKAPKGCGLGTN